jgi:hypothetical protein
LFKSRGCEENRTGRSWRRKGERVKELGGGKGKGERVRELGGGKGERVRELGGGCPHKAGNPSTL